MSQQWRYSVELAVHNGSPVVAKSATTKNFLAVQISDNVQNLHIAASRTSFTLEACA